MKGNRLHTQTHKHNPMIDSVWRKIAIFFTKLRSLFHAAFFYLIVKPPFAGNGSFRSFFHQGRYENTNCEIVERKQKMKMKSFTLKLPKNLQKGPRRVCDFFLQMKFFLGLWIEVGKNAKHSIKCALKSPYMTSPSNFINTW